MKKPTGKKYDTGKPLAGMVQSYFSHAFNLIFKVATMGAEKYGRDNWLGLDKAEQRYHDAMYRHLNQMEMGEEIDKESKLPHLAHAVWNGLALMQLKAVRGVWDKVK